MTHQTFFELRIDPEAVDAALAADQGLPSSWYYDPRNYEFEAKEILARSWTYITHASAVQKPGTVLVESVGRTPIIVVTDDRGEVRAFLNMCRHRAHPVCETAGQAKGIVCRYHGWSYRLDGTLRVAPGLAGASEKDRSLGLIPVRLERWGPFLFVNLDPNAPSLNEVHPNLKDIVRSRELDLDVQSYDFVRRYQSRIHANWKLWYDNTVECYHCPTVHSKSFSDAYNVDPKYYETLLQHRLISYFFPKRSETNTQDLKVTFNRHLHLFPGFALIQQDDIMVVLQMQSLGPSELRFYWDLFAQKGASVERVEAWGKIWDDTFNEDQSVVEAVQRAVETGLFPGNRYVSSREQPAQFVAQLIWSDYKRVLSG